MTKAVIASKTKRALIAAAGTGGHIFPGLAIAEGLKRKHWNIVWLGTKNGMENRLIPKENIQFESIDFNGVRGKGAVAWLLMPFKLIKGVYDCCWIIAKVKPDIVIGFGGYVSLPAGLAAKLFSKTLLLHEQNSVMGLSNKILSYTTKLVFTAFPYVMKEAIFAGNPLRAEFLNIPSPVVRFKNRQGRLRILIIGGSLGAKFLNETIPEAIKLIPIEDRPHITHQSGEKQFTDLQQLYKSLKVEAEVLSFIENTAIAFANADLIICRAGASTVSEIIAVGAAVIFVPLPLAVDDHQTKNANYLVSHDAAWLRPQNQLTAQILADEIVNLNRETLLKKAVSARNIKMPNTVEIMVKACQESTV